MHFHVFQNCICNRFLYRSHWQSHNLGFFSFWTLLILSSVFVYRTMVLIGFQTLTLYDLKMYRTQRSIWFWHIPWHILYTSLTLLINSKTRDKPNRYSRPGKALIDCIYLFYMKTLNFWKWSKLIKSLR